MRAPKSLDAALVGIDAAILATPPDRDLPELDRDFIQAARR
jgi:hypothetical protein